MEPERDIEKALRSYSARRREQAGGPAEMHPATRRLLHGELARRGRRPHRRGWTAMLNRPLMRFAIAGCVVSAGVVTAILFQPGATRSASSSSDVEMLALGGTRAPADAGAEQYFFEPAKTEASAAAAPSPASESSLAAVAAPPAESPKVGSTRGSFTKADAELFLADASAPGAPAVSPANRAPSSATVQMKLDAPVVGPSQKFVQVAARSREFGSSTSAAQSESQVLNSFRLTQEGSQIQVVDADGSVYNGSIQLSENDDRVAVAKDALVHRQAEREESGAAAPSALFNYALNFSGTNRSLNQSVSFTGNLLGTTNAGAAGSISNTFTIVGFQQIVNGLPQVPLANARIQGTATLDNREPVRVDAVPTK